MPSTSCHATTFCLDLRLANGHAIETGHLPPITAIVDHYSHGIVIYSIVDHCHGLITEYRARGTVDINRP